MFSAEAVEEERSDPYPEAQNIGHKVKSNVQKTGSFFLCPWLVVKWLTLNMKIISLDPKRDFKSNARDEIYNFLGMNQE